MSIKEFKKKAKEKFQKGVDEHGAGWDDVNHVKEFNDELYDAYNYIEGAAKYNDKNRCESIKSMIISIWSVSNRYLVENKEI